MSIQEFKEAILPETLIGSDYQRIGIGGFYFYAVLSESVTKTATITTNPVEDGSQLNDHIIKNPTSVTIEGEVSKLFIELQNTPQILQRVFEPVGIIEEYLPERTQTQISKINGIIADVNDYYEQVETAIEKGQQIYDFFTDAQAEQTLTQKFLEFFNKVYESKSVLDVECVDTIYNDMGVTSFTVVKPKDEKDTYKFTISLTKIVKAETRVLNLRRGVSISGFLGSASGDVKSQGSKMANKGTQSTTKITDRSFLSTITGLF